MEILPENLPVSRIYPLCHKILDDSILNPGGDEIMRSNNRVVEDIPRSLEDGFRNGNRFDESAERDPLNIGARLRFRRDSSSVNP